MKKVALRHAEYMASLPPYRFAPGDVIEIEDDWADHLLRLGIATAAKSNAKTVQQIRIDARPPVPTPADERAVRRAALEAEIAALNSQDAATVEDEEGDDDEDDAAAGEAEGHYSDMITRGENAEPGTALPGRRGGRRGKGDAPEPQE